VAAYGNGGKSWMHRRNKSFELSLIPFLPPMKVSVTPSLVRHTVPARG
jgi:hypothetical protein